MSKKGNSLMKPYKFLLSNENIGKPIIEYKNELYEVVSVEKGKNKSWFSCKRYYGEYKTLAVNDLRKEVEYFDCIEPIGAF